MIIYFIICIGFACIIGGIWHLSRLLDKIFWEIVAIHHQFLGSIRDDVSHIKFRVESIESSSLFKKPIEP